MPATVNDRDHDDVVISSREEHAIREAPEEGAARAALDHRKQGWCALGGCEDSVDSAKELAAQALALVLVPIESGRDVGLG